MEYIKGVLLEADVVANPFEQFTKWHEEAFSVDPDYSNAMTLSTVDEGGLPSSRIVLFKDISFDGFTFYTNYNSKKATDLKGNANVALNFFWQELERQVRIEGRIEYLSAEESDVYFASRPFESKVGAWVSNQSKVIETRDELEVLYNELLSLYADKEVPRPKHWGGIVVIPTKIEFWQGRPNRLNDRLLYSKMGENWIIERLAP